MRSQVAITDQKDRALVGTSYSVTLRNLGMLMDQPSESILSRNASSRQDER